MSGFLAAVSSASYTKSARIQVLPAEILSHIFIILTESNFYARSIGKKNWDLVHYPILLSSVCSLWRCIALHTSCLWSFFDVRRPGQSRIEPSLLNCFLERSRETSLRVRLGGYNRFLTRDTVEGLAASILQSGGSRLRSLGIFHELLKPIIKVLLLVSSKDIVVPLRELALGTRRASQFNYIATEPEELFQNDLGTLFEPLHALHLRNIWLNWDIFPCQNLVELQLIDQPGSRFPTGMQLSTMLRANPRLQLLVLHVRSSVVDAQTFEHTTEPIRLPMLQKLDLRTIESFVVDFLGLLFPAQHGFCLRLANSPQEGNGQKTIAALEKLSHRTELIWLHILDRWLKVPTGSYGSLQNLRHLILVGYGILGETVDGMSQAVNCLSRLNTITLVGYNVDETTLSKVFSWNSSNSLQAVRLQACSFWDGDEVSYEDVAAPFVEKGLDGIVTHSNDPDLYEFSSSFFL